MTSRVGFSPLLLSGNSQGKSAGPAAAAAASARSASVRVAARASMLIEAGLPAPCSHLLGLAALARMLRGLL